LDAAPHVSSAVSPAASFSAVLITRNAAHQIEPCLRSLAFANEILVVDSGSDDATKELAQRLGARVIHQKWLGYGRQKQFAAEQAAHEWVLCLDADERITPELRASILRSLAAPASPVYRMARRNRFMGRWLAHGEGYPDWSARLFRRDAARWSADEVHEKLLYSVTPGILSGDLEHDSAESLAQYMDKQNRYSTLAARQLQARGHEGGAAQLVLSPLVRFMKFYFFHLGFLDGLPGLVHISIGCMNSYMKYAKLLELQRAERRS